MRLDRVLVGVQLVGRVEFGLELERLVRRPLQPQRLQPVARLAPDALRLTGSGSACRGCTGTRCPRTGARSGSSSTIPPRTDCGCAGKVLIGGRRRGRGAANWCGEIWCGDRRAARPGASAPGTGRPGRADARHRADGPPGRRPAGWPRRRRGRRRGTGPSRPPGHAASSAVSAARTPAREAEARRPGRRGRAGRCAPRSSPCHLRAPFADGASPRWVGPGEVALRGRAARACGTRCGRPPARAAW